MNNLYKQRLPNRDLHGHTLDVLRLSQEQYGDFQGVAKQWLGGTTFHEAVPRHPPQKCLPSALQTITDVDQNTLAALMHVEEHAHADHSKEFHRGGGLWETGRSIFSALWRLSPVGYATDKLMDVMGFKPKPTELTDRDRFSADIVGEAYKKSGRDDLLGNYMYWPEYSDQKMAVYVNKDTHDVQIGIRGTKVNASDLLSDLRIVGGNTSGHERQVGKQLRDILASFPGDVWDFTVSGHSLGGLELMNVIKNPPDENDVTQFSRIDRINLYNPGLTPTHNLSTAKEAVRDDKFNFYLNSGDLISNGFASIVNSDSNVHWGKPGANPLSNHSLSQWEGDV